MSRSIRSILTVAGAALALALAAPAAQAVTVDYCQYSLRGGGSLAPDDDLYRIWRHIENSTGRQLASSHWLRAGRSGDDFVYTDRVYYFNNGQALGWRFYCNDARPSGGYHDDDWYQVPV